MWHEKKGDGPVPDEGNSTANNKLQNVFLDKQFIIVYLFVFASCTRVYCHAVSRAYPSIWIKILIHCKSFEARMIWKQKKKAKSTRAFIFIETLVLQMPIWNIRAYLFRSEKIYLHWNEFALTLPHLARLISMKLNAINSFWSVNKMKWNHHRNGQKLIHSFVYFWPLSFFPIEIFTNMNWRLRKNEPKQLLLLLFWTVCEYLLEFFTRDVLYIVWINCNHLFPMRWN